MSENEAYMEVNRSNEVVEPDYSDYDWGHLIETYDFSGLSRSAVSNRVAILLEIHKLSFFHLTNEGVYYKHDLHEEYIANAFKVNYNTWKNTRRDIVGTLIKRPHRPRGSNKKLGSLRNRTEILEDRMDTLEKRIEELEEND